MRKITVIKEILEAAISAILDAVAIVIARKCGCPNWVTLIVGFLPSMLGMKLISKLVEKLFSTGKKITVAAVILILVLSGEIIWKFGGENIWSSLPTYIILGISFTVIVRIVVRYRTRKAEERVTRDLKKTGGEVLMDEEYIGKAIDELKGENREITVEYPKEDAATCENGVFVGKREKGVIAFRGIPYAKAPVGDLRWKQPQRVTPSQKVFEAYYYGKSEPQPYRNYSPACKYDMSEDCLTLNVWKSARETENRPVTVWIDTLDWCTGGTATPLKDGDEFVLENPEIIFVNLNFRLGLFGNMDFSDIPGGEAYQDAKNLGLSDIIEALRWIQRNIAAFGGDPSNVTLVGGTGGGVAAVLLTVNKEAEGLFRRMVSFGGSLTFTNSMSSFRSAQKEVRRHLKVKTMDEFLNLPADRLAGVLDEIESYNIGFPVSDGKMVPLNYRQAFAKSPVSGIDMLCCIPAGEAGILQAISGDKQVVRGKFDELIKTWTYWLTKSQRQCLEKYVAQYYKPHPESSDSIRRLKTELYYHYPMLKICQLHSLSGAATRYLVWDIKSPVDEIGSSSLITFLVLRNREDYYEYCGVTGDPLVFRAVRRMLVNFAKTGDPSLKYGELSGVGEESFPVYDNADGSVTVLTEQGLAQDGGELSRRMKQLEPLDSLLF